MGQPRSRWATSTKNKQLSRAEKATRLGEMYGAGPKKLPLTATELTADTCCALGVHSRWCGCADA